MRILFFSDTHGKHGDVKIPNDINIAIFGGDAGTYKEVIPNKEAVLNFIEWYATVPIKHKVWIAGNHDTSIEAGLVDAKQLSKDKGLIYLEDESCEIDGIKIFGSPSTPRFGYGWAFNVNRGDEIANKWEIIPEGLDVLITHGPPYGILDYTWNGMRAGCEELYKRLWHVRPKIHIFGHIHESSGYKTMDGISFINASVLGEDYNYQNNPIIITLDDDKEIIDVEIGY